MFRVSAHAAAIVFGLTALAGGAASAADGAGTTRREKLPPGALRGPEDRLQQYPRVKLATPEQRAAAARLLANVRASTARWRDPIAAAAAGYGVGRFVGAPRNGSVGWYHAEHRRGFHRDGRFLDPRAPETLIFANTRRWPLVLVGVMFAVPRRVHGPTPGGPITRWHTHQVCRRGDARGLKPRPNGTCPKGFELRQGSEMMHVWLTRDLRSAFAIHAPVHELCIARLLPLDRCDHSQHGH
jgi:hypothetical protein